MNSMLRIGLVGTGKISQNFLGPAIQHVDGAVLWSVLSRDQCRANAFAKRHRASSPNPGFCDQDQFLSDNNLDAVIIATPDGLHAKQTIAAAKRGKHVLVEKPMATSIEDAELMIKMCEQFEVALAVGYHLRWHNGHQLLMKQLESGQLGELYHARAHWSFRADNACGWHNQENLGRWWSLAGVGTHLIDWVRWLFIPTCGNICRLDSIISRGRFGHRGDEAATVNLQFDSGATAQIFSSVLAEGPTRAEIIGSAGYAYCENTFGQTGGGLIEISGNRLHFDFINPYVREINDFVSAINNGRKPKISGEEGLRNIEILCEIAPS